MFSSFAELLTGTKREFRDAAEAGDLTKVVAMYEGGQCIDSTSDYGATALHKASARGKLAMVRFLLAHEAKTGTVHKGGRTALGEAELQGHVEVAAVLREHMGVVVVEAKDEEEDDEDEGVVSAVERLEVKKEEPPSSLANSVAKVASSTTEAVGDFVTGRKYSLLEVVTGKKRAFRDAAESGDLALVQQLVQQGQHVDSKSDYGSTALHKAALGGHIHVVEFLLAHGADVNARHTGGLTPLEEAEGHRHEEAAALLRSWDRLKSSTTVRAFKATSADAGAGSSSDAVVDASSTPVNSCGIGISLSDLVNGSNGSFLHAAAEGDVAGMLRCIVKGQGTAGGKPRWG
jgi:ankyrin repeat protein